MNLGVKTDLKIDLNSQFTTASEKTRSGWCRPGDILVIQASITIKLLFFMSIHQGSFADLAYVA